MCDVSKHVAWVDYARLQISSRFSADHRTALLEVAPRQYAPVPDTPTAYSLFKLAKSVSRAFRE